MTEQDCLVLVVFDYDIGPSRMTLLEPDFAWTTRCPDLVGERE